MIRVNEIFKSIQGEGAHFGRPAIFVRLAGCNLRCSFCDTDFDEFHEMTEPEICDQILELYNDGDMVILTGGEPGMQYIDDLCSQIQNIIRKDGGILAIETNGMFKIPHYINWICLSPKTSMNHVVLEKFDEIKFVIKHGKKLPDIDRNETRFMWCKHFWISPENDGKKLNKKNIDHCVDLLLCDNEGNVPWKLNMQMHKIIGVE